MLRDRPKEAFLLGAALTGALLAGCLGPPADAPGGSAPPRLLAPPLGAALWDDPQLFPHPAFGWPTVTHVPPGAPAWWQPIPARALPADIAGLEPLAHLEEGQGGERIAVFGRLAVIPGPFRVGSGATSEPPGTEHPVTVLDLTDPAAPRVLASLDPGLATYDAALLPYPSGRLVLVLATLSNLLPLYDLTDPAHPEELAPLATGSPGHNLGLVPGTPILYNANAGGGGPQGNVPGRGAGSTEVFDLSDPEQPVLVQDWANGYGCHTITFYVDPGAAKLRAYCAGIEATQIWDIGDPRAPRVLATIPVHHDNPALPGAGAFPARASTMTAVNARATTLAISDEAGFGVPGCEVYAHQGGRTVASPHGALWLYDITDEARPALRGWFSAGPFLAQGPPRPHPFLTPADPGACLAHYAHLVPHPSRDLLLLAMAQGGVALVDVTDPAAPVLVDQWREDAFTTDAWFVQGYVVVANWDRGLDVLTFR